MTMRAIPADHPNNANARNAALYPNPLQLHCHFRHLQLMKSGPNQVRQVSGRSSKARHRVLAAIVAWFSSLSERRTIVRNITELTRGSLFCSC